MKYRKVWIIEDLNYRESVVINSSSNKTGIINKFEEKLGQIKNLVGRTKMVGRIITATKHKPKLIIYNCKNVGILYRMEYILHTFSNEHANVQVKIKIQVDK